MEHIKTADNGKNDGVNAEKIEGGAVAPNTDKKKGLDYLLIDNARDEITKQERIVLKRFFNDFCSVKDDGVVHCVINNDYLDFFKVMVQHLTTLDADLFVDKSKNKFLKVVNLAVNTSLKLKLDNADKTDIKSYKSKLVGVGVITFVKQFALAFMYIFNYELVTYNGVGRLVDADTYKQVKQENDFMKWQNIKLALGLIEEEKDGE